jgi:NADH-ubiquinone oxidoreductase chain 2
MLPLRVAQNFVFLLPLACKGSMPLRGNFYSYFALARSRATARDNKNNHKNEARARGRRARGARGGERKRNSIQVMLFITIIILIVAKALPVLNTQISSSQFSRLTSISLIFAGLISLNSLYLETIGSGIGIYSGLFHITQISQIFEIFIYFIGGFILMGWYQSKILSGSPSLASSSGEHFYSESYFSLASSEARSKVTRYAANASTASIPNGNRENNNMTDYSLIILFSILGSSLLITSFDLISIYLSIELQSFGLYVLSTLYKNSESSTSSGLKYFLLGGLSSCIILLGIGLIYSYTGITNLESLYILNTVSPSAYLSEEPFNLAVQGLSIGLILIFVGFLFKIAAAPLHNWSPDVYDGTPTIVTSWLTIIPKISILILLLELQIQLGNSIPLAALANTTLGVASATFSSSAVETLPLLLGALYEGSLCSLLFEEAEEGLISNTGYILNGFNTSIILGSNNTIIPVIKTLLLISSVLSLIVGSLLGLAQIRIKRLLAYSTISHIGFLLLALAINTEQSIDSFLFYLIQYTLTNLNIFLIILAFTYLRSPPRGKGGSNTDISISDGIKDIRHISEFKGLFFSNPLLSLSLAISLFSMAGIPPLIGFFSKQFVLYSALQNGYYFISILAIIVSVISASYYLKIVKVLLDTENTDDATILSSLSKRGTVVALPCFLLCFLPEGEEEAEGEALSNIHSYIISTLTLIILLFFIKPSIILNSTKLLTLSLFSI